MHRKTNFLLNLYWDNKYSDSVVVSGKQVSSTPLSHSNLIFTICHIKAKTHSNTVGIHAPTGDFGQE